MTGGLLRFMWAFPEYLIIDAKHLTHAHSHVALLGWGWIMIAGYILDRHVKTVRKEWIVKLYAALLHISVAGMLITFSMDGYWKWSIIFSAAHVILSIAFLLYYGYYRSKHTNGASQTAFDAALILALISNLGPLLLSLGSMQNAASVTIAVNSYVHLQCFGFLLLSAIGIAIDTTQKIKPSIKTNTYINCIYVMALSVVPAQLVAVSSLIPGLLVLIIGSASMAIFALAGFRMLYLLKRNYDESAINPFQIFVKTSYSGALVLFTILLLSTMPVIRAPFEDARFMAIGVIHLVLLVVVTPILLDYGRQILEFNSVKLKWPALSVLTGSVVMVGLLIFGGLAQGLKFILPMNIQFWLMITALPVIVGLLLLGFTKVRYHGFRRMI
jgi:hypothetical protein